MIVNIEEVLKKELSGKYCKYTDDTFGNEKTLYVYIKNIESVSCMSCSSTEDKFTIIGDAVIITEHLTTRVLNPILPYKDIYKIEYFTSLPLPLPFAGLVSKEDGVKEIIEKEFKDKLEKVYNTIKECK